MTTRRYDRVAYGAELREVILGCAGRAATVTLSDVELEDGVAWMTAVVVEEPGHDRWRKECEGPGCDVVWFAESPKARFHSGACRVAAFRAAARAQAEALIDAVNETGEPS